MLAADNAESTQPIAPSLPQGAHDAVSIRSSTFSAGSPANPLPPLSLSGSDVIGNNRHLSARFTFASFTNTSSPPRRFLPRSSISCSLMLHLPFATRRSQTSKVFNEARLTASESSANRAAAAKLRDARKQGCRRRAGIHNHNAFYSTTAASPPNSFFPQSIEGLRAQLEELTYKQKRLERNINTMQLQRAARLQTLQPHAPLHHASETQESVSSAPLQTAVGNVKAGGARSSAAGQRLKAADDDKGGKASRFLNLENVSV